MTGARAGACQQISHACSCPHHTADVNWLSFANCAASRCFNSSRARVWSPVRASAVLYARRTERGRQGNAACVTQARKTGGSWSNSRMGSSLRRRLRSFVWPRFRPINEPHQVRRPDQAQEPGVSRRYLRWAANGGADQSVGSAARACHA